MHCNLCVGHTVFVGSCCGISKNDPLSQEHLCLNTSTGPGAEGYMLLQYKRLIYFDVDGLVLKNMNHLFKLPAAPVAMPRAYWLPQPTMSDQLAVVEPSVSSLHELLHQAEIFGEGLQHLRRARPWCMGWVLQAACGHFNRWALLPVCLLLCAASLMCGMDC